MYSSPHCVFDLNRSRLSRIFLVVGLVLLSSYCTRPESQTKIPELTEDERYLVRAYVRIAEARDMRSLSYLKSESLFASIDSTIDTTRIANTIDELNRDPERWLLVFESIKKDLKSAQGQDSEETR